MATEHNNGDGAAQVVPVGETIQIVFTRQPYGVQLVAHGADVRMCIAVLRTALDELEAQLRLVRVAQIQQSQADAAIAQRIMQGKRG